MVMVEMMRLIIHIDGQQQSDHRQTKSGLLRVCWPLWSGQVGDDDDSDFCDDDFGDVDCLDGQNYKFEEETSAA